MSNDGIWSVHQDNHLSDFDCWKIMWLYLFINTVIFFKLLKWHFKYFFCNCQLTIRLTIIFSKVGVSEHYWNYLKIILLFVVATLFFIAF